MFTVIKCHPVAEFHQETSALDLLPQILSVWSKYQSIKRNMVDNIVCVKKRKNKSLSTICFYYLG